jgi:hypothetical protein
MKATIEDRDALAAISPSALSAYVRAEGWSSVEKFGDHSDVYVREKHPELILPGVDTLGDYPDVISNIIQLLARSENRDEMQVYKDLVVADRDVIRVRAPEADDDGSVRIEAGMGIILQAHDMLLSAACAAREPRPTYRAGKIKEASSYMDRVRLGQTEQGSFIVALLAPVPPTLELAAQNELWPNLSAEPFERIVTRRLADSLIAAHSAAEQAVRRDGLNSFKQVVARGVSANLCDALAGLIDFGQGLEVSVTWARTRPTPEARRTVEFSKTEAEVYREAARLFRFEEPRSDERLQGYIISADRDISKEQGVVTLKTFLDGQPTSIKTQLPPNMYSTALEVHGTKAAISITGDLVRKGQRWWLENPRDLLQLQEDSDSD